MSVIKPALQYPERISYFAGANNYCWLYFRNGEKKLLAKPISYLETKLPDFIRVHKTVLVNPLYIKSLHQPPRKKMAGEVLLDSGEVFPVSRRRWQQVVDLLQNWQTAPTQYSGPPVSEVTVPYVTTPTQSPTTTSILFVTDDKEKSQRTEQIVHRKWTSYIFNVIQQSTLLVDLLRQSPSQERPTLILLDARTATLERLHTLRYLKEDAQLSQIPVVLLVSPGDRLVIEGYQYQANSVVSMPKEYALFDQTIERVLQFWLQTATLPATN